MSVDLPIVFTVHIPIITIDKMHFSVHQMSCTAEPAAVEGLTINIRLDELLIHWDNSVGVVSYYAVYVRVDGKEKLQINAITHELKYKSEALSEYGTIEVQVFAINDAGVGPSATVTIPFGNTTKEQGKILKYHICKRTYIISYSCTF